jgi:Chaperone of endosialidase
MKTQVRSVHATLVIALLLGCFWLRPQAKAVVPPPDGGYPGGNTAEGQAALLSLTVGTYNTAVGFFSLRALTFGQLNTAVGAGTLLFNNGHQNTAIGAAALLSNVTGHDNTANGAGALLNNTSGDSNIALGNSAGSLLTTGNFNIDIGNPGLAGESSTIRIGNNLQTRTFIAGIRGVTTGNANAIPVLIDSLGQLGTMSSSRRFKEEIKPMDQISETIHSLRPVTFHYKSDTRDMPQFGLIAEEVAKVNPDLVVREENGEIYTVRYDAVNAMLLNEFLKEHRKVEEQNGKLENQARKIQEQETTIAELKSGMKALAATVSEQTAQLRKVSALIETMKPAARVAVNNP